MVRERRNEPDNPKIGYEANGEGPPNRRYLSGIVTSILALVALFGYQLYMDRIGPTGGPLSDLVFVEHATGAQLDSFKQNCMKEICEPTLQVMNEFKEMRFESEQGKAKPEGFGGEIKRLRHRLAEIDSEARLRKIPAEYRAQYENLVTAIHSLGRSLDEFEKALLASNDEDRKTLYQASHHSLDDARVRCCDARDYFALRL